VAYPLIPRSRAAEDFASLVDLSRYAQAQSPVLGQPTRFEDILSAIPLRLQSEITPGRYTPDRNIRQPAIVGDIPLWKNALLRLKGRPRFGYAELLGRF
jgi:hypothetical protein